MRPLRLVLLVVLLASGMLVTGGAGTAFACSCAYQRTPEFVGMADEIFAGTVVSMVDPPKQAIMSSTDPITYTVAVDAVYRGDVGVTAVFGSPMSGASCGLENIVVDRRYLVFLSTDGSERTASLCGGTAPATPRRLDAVERLTGPPAQPTAVADTTAVASGAEPRATRDDRLAQASGWTWTVGGIIGVGVLLGVGLMLRRRSTRGGAS